MSILKENQLRDRMAFALHNTAKKKTLKNSLGLEARAGTPSS